MNHDLILSAENALAKCLPKAVALLMALMLAPAFAAPTEISNSPLASTRSAQVKPNVMLLMDTSGSMARTHMPDELENNSGYNNVGYKNSGCNALYYNPAQTYDVPRRADGTFFSVPSFTAAPYDAYDTTAGTKDLSTNQFQAYDTNTLAVKGTADTTSTGAYYYKYTGSAALKFDTAPCTDADTGATRAATGGGQWQRVVVGASTGVGTHVDERANFATWYSYYRTRMNLTKTAASLAFTELNDSYRVGFITVEPTKGSASPPNVNPDKFLKIDDFGQTQRTAWFDKLFSQKPEGSSPAREGLARVGRYYGGKGDGINSGMRTGASDDPMKFSCQQNFTILTTDGYWNAQTEQRSLAGGFKGGPVQLDGKTWVGEQDGDITDAAGNTPRPIWDGFADTLRTTTDKLDTFSDVACNTTAPLLSRTQTIASSRTYTTSTTQTVKTTTGYTSTDSLYKVATNKYATSTSQLQESAVQYSIAKYQYTTGTTQLTRTDTPWTTKVTTNYSTVQSQLTEKKSQAQENRTQFTKKVTEYWTTTRTQKVATTTQKWLSTAQSTSVQTQKLTQTYQTISFDATTERGTPVDTCTDSSTIICQKKILTAFAPSATCTAGSTGSPNYVKTECQDKTISALAPVATCTPGTSSSGSPNYITTVCTYTVTSPPAAVQNCTTGTTQSSQGSGYVLSICELRAITTAVPVPTCTAGQSSSSPYTTTTCADGPQALATSNSDVCTAGTTSPTSANDYLTTVCVHSGPTTVYVDPTTACTNQTGTSANGWLANITCTAGTVKAPTFVATCTPKTDTTVTPNEKVTCSTVPATPVATAVDSCTIGTTNSGAPNYVTTVCANGSGYPKAAVASAACVDGSVVSTGSPSYIKTTCKVTGPTTTYVQAKSSCTANTASSSNGNTITCSTPAPTGPYDVATCTAGTTGTDPNKVQVTCGSRVLTAPTTGAICTPGTTTNPSTGVSTTCNRVTTQAATISATACTPGTTSTGSPPTETVCTKSIDQPMTPVSACTVALGTTAGVSPTYITRTCTDVPQAASTPIVTCSAGTTVGGSPNFLRTTCTVTPLTAATASAPCTVGDTLNGDVTSTCTFTQSAALPSSTCTAAGSTTDPSTKVITTCSFNSTTTKMPSEASCVEEQPSSTNSYQTKTCATTKTPAAFGPACTPGTTGGAPDYLFTTCVAGTATPAAPANCSPGTSTGGAADNYATTTCSQITISPETPAPCTVGSSTDGSTFITTTCRMGPATGLKRLITESTTVSQARFSGTTQIGNSYSVTPPAPTVSDFDGGMCHVPAIDPLPVLPAPQRPMTGMPGSCLAWPCTESSSLTGISTNALADVAQYYYVTDLRPEYPNTGPEKVPSTGSGPEDDRVTSQHMTTFTIGLGVSGTLNYRSDYRSSAVGDFADLRTGVRNWPEWPPLPGSTSPSGDTYLYNSDGVLTNFLQWEDPRSIDDFWHTAVNGRGQYFSAKDPTSVITGVKDALAGIAARVASASGASTSTLEPVAGDNFAYIATYQTAKWVGDVQAYEIDVGTGQVAAAPFWSASALLDGRTRAACDSRNIYLMRMGATDNMVNFTWNSYVCDADGKPTGTASGELSTDERAYFGVTNVSLLSQYPSMTDGTAGSADQRTPAVGANLVNYLRGQRGFEGFQANDAGKLYRARDHVLGDIVDAQPVYVKAPFASYQDAGYDAFKTSNANRTPMLYVAANDGMLHAFRAGTGTTDAEGGSEAWAIVPSSVLPRMYNLASSEYSINHRFLVDGTPTAGDVLDARVGAGTWRTILVGGLGAGGRGYYAVDVTEPLSPKVLWEFKWGSACFSSASQTAAYSDCHLGFSFGRPVITKLAGRWVVMVTSGYNNLNSPATTGDGIGYLYVLDAMTGAIIDKISTGAGDSTTPSGLAQLNNFVDNGAVDNTTVRVYGGDLLGNIWRFDVNDNLAPDGKEATLLGVAKDSGGTRQPITTKPELAELNGKPMVFMATGRLLGSPDVSDTSGQSIYGIVDPLVGAPSYSDLRSVLKPLALTQTGVRPTAQRTVRCTGTDAQCALPNGWVVDLPDAGERVNVDMQLVLGTLVVASNVPDNSACSTGGYSWFNYFDFATGLGVDGATVIAGSGAVADRRAVSNYQASSLVVGFGLIRLGGQNGSSSGIRAIIRTSDGETMYATPPIGTPPPSGKRISWREIAQ